MIFCLPCLLNGQTSISKTDCEAFFICSENFHFQWKKERGIFLKKQFCPIKQKETDPITFLYFLWKIKPAVVKSREATGLEPFLIQSGGHTETEQEKQCKPLPPALPQQKPLSLWGSLSQQGHGLQWWKMSLQRKLWPTQTKPFPEKGRREIWVYFTGFLPTQKKPKQNPTKNSALFLDLFPSKVKWKAGLSKNTNKILSLALKTSSCWCPMLTQGPSVWSPYSQFSFLGKQFSCTWLPPFKGTVPDGN